MPSLRTIEQAIQEAHLALMRSEPQTAIDLLEDALRHAPGNRDALMLLEEAERARVRQESERVARDGYLAEALETRGQVWAAVIIGVLILLVAIWLAIGTISYGMQHGFDAQVVVFYAGRRSRYPIYGPVHMRLIYPALMTMVSAFIFYVVYRNIRE